MNPSANYFYSKRNTCYHIRMSRKKKPQGNDDTKSVNLNVQ